MYEALMGDEEFEDDDEADVPVVPMDESIDEEKSG